MVFTWWLRRFGGDERWRGTQVRVEVPASWLMMIWYGSVGIQVVLLVSPHLKTMQRSYLPEN